MHKSFEALVRDMDQKQDELDMDAYVRCVQERNEREHDKHREQLHDDVIEFTDDLWED